jgi:biopolymer transport protein ExbD
MTAMSDVTVLLLTFFMLTSTFVKKEPIQVTTPASVSEFKIPENNLLTIMINADGKVFFGLELNQQEKVETLKRVGEDYNLTFTPQQLQVFMNLKSFGVPIRSLASFLDLPTDLQDKYLQDQANLRVGIPATDEKLADVRGTIADDNEFKRWVTYARQQNGKEMGIAIKADQTTAYPIIKKVMDDLRELRENRYLLITSLRTASSL